MTVPNNVELDLDAKAGYIRDGEIAGTVDVWRDGRVAADVDADGNVLGIEILSFDAETLSKARTYAMEHGLAFPANINGATTVGA